MYLTTQLPAYVSSFSRLVPGDGEAKERRRKPPSPLPGPLSLPAFSINQPKRGGNNCCFPKSRSEFDSGTQSDRHDQCRFSRRRSEKGKPHYLTDEHGLNKRFVGRWSNGIVRLPNQIIIKSVTTRQFPQSDRLFQTSYLLRRSALLISLDLADFSQSHTEKSAKKQTKRCF